MAKNLMEVLPQTTSISGPPARLRRRQSRAERSEDVRKAIFAAAAKVIGERGYAEASISRITEIAGIAQGTFYLYFESRQALFDELLLVLGQEMLAKLHQAASGAQNFFEVEERGARALFEYIDQQPGFSRILHEAEFAAPLAYERHYRMLCERYADSLRRAVKAGDIRDLHPDELEAMVHMLIYARSGLLHNARQKASQGETADRQACIQAYMRLVRHGVR